MIGVMLWVNWRFTLIALSVAPLLFLVVYAFTRRIKAASRAVRKRESALLSDVAEVLTSIRVVQAFAREDYEEQRFEAESLDNVKAALQARSMKARLPSLVDVIVAGGTCLVLGYGARLVLDGQISAGVLIVFVLYLSKMYKPMRDLSKMTDTVSKAAVGYERIREVLDRESRVQDQPGARRAPRFKARIEFDHVTFNYGDEAAVLKDVSFRIEPGQVAAIVGASGAGKSDDRQPDSPLLRSGGRSRPHRRHGRARIHAEVAARSNQLRPAGHRALSRKHLGQHRVWQPQGDAARDIARREAGERAGIHRADAQRVRHAGWRARRVAFRRTTSAHRHRQGDRPEHTDPRSRRADGQSRRGVRGGGRPGTRID